MAIASDMKHQYAFIINCTSDLRGSLYRANELSADDVIRMVELAREQLNVIRLSLTELRTAAVALRRKERGKAAA